MQYPIPLPPPRPIAAAVLAAALGLSAGVEAQEGRYLRLELGPTRNPGITLDGSDNDWSTQCDLLINPDQIEVGDRCATPPPRTSWSHDFARGGGVIASLAAGWRLTGNLRIEGEYSFLGATLGDELAFRIGDVETQDKAEQELETTEGSAQDLKGHAAFANLYFDPLPDAGISPYVGVGVGAMSASLDYFVRWKRNDDPAYITTFRDPLLNAKVAGTTTIGRTTLSDLLFGYQAIVGAEFGGFGPAGFGVRLRRAAFSTLEGDDEWVQLRSHESDVGRGERIRYLMTTGDVSLWALSFTIRYEF